MAVSAGSPGSGSDLSTCAMSWRRFRGPRFARSRRGRTWCWVRCLPPLQCRLRLRGREPLSQTRPVLRGTVRGIDLRVFTEGHGNRRATRGLPSAEEALHRPPTHTGRAGRAAWAAPDIERAEQAAGSARRRRVSADGEVARLGAAEERVARITVPKSGTSWRRGQRPRRGCTPQSGCSADRETQTGSRSPSCSRRECSP